MVMTKKQAIKEELLSLSRKNGHVTPEEVVAFARNPKTALHSQFVWNDGEAAEKYRLLQAQKVIRICVEIIPRPDGEGNRLIRTFISLPSDRASGDGYAITANILSDAELRAEALASIAADLQAIERKYATYSDKSVVGFVSEIAAVRLKYVPKKPTPKAKPKKARPTARA